MVRAMVQVHIEHERPSSPVSNEDHNVNSGVGKAANGTGLVVLHYGVSGVGKNATAECVARENGKPRFPITSHDLGLRPHSVEADLTEKFRSAQLWDCVILLDVVHISLSQRKECDLRHNSIVSVFLRVLEYYPGIIFLTTNMVESLDFALKSRIHFELYYPHSARKQIRDIWNINISALENSISCDETQILKFAASFPSDQCQSHKSTDLGITTTHLHPRGYSWNSGREYAMHPKRQFSS